MNDFIKYCFICSLGLFSIGLSGQSYDLDSAFFRLTQMSLHESVQVQYETRINTDQWEFSPTYYRSGIVYVGSRSDKKSIDYENKTPFFTLRYAEFSKEGKLALPSAFGVRNSPEMHEGPLDFSADETRMYYTKSVPAEEERRKIPLQIYVAEKGAEYWEDIGPLNFQDPTKSYAHPSLSKDGNTMIFAAELDDGYGGMDLYASEKENGVWSEPKNLGDEVNSGGNEVFPRLHSSGILFYASNGLDDGRDLDIFATAKINGEYTIPKRLQAPFNSDEDDFGIIFNRDGTSGYFNSSRSDSEGEDDIISFTSDVDLIPYEKDIRSIEFIVLDKTTKKRLSDAAVNFFKIDDDGLFVNRNLYESRIESEGEEVNIRLKLKDPSQFPESSMKTGINGEVRLEYSTDTDGIFVVSKKGYNPRQINVDSISGTEMKVNLKYIDCISLNVNVISENNDTIESNYTLINECSGNIVKESKSKIGLFTACMQPDCYYTLITESSGFNSDTSIFLSPREEDTLSKIIRLTSSSKELASEKSSEKESLDPSENISDIESLDEGDVLVLRRIYYDFNKSSIRSGAAEDLKALAVLLKQHPDLRIELNSHTDSRGSAEYNLELSLERAQSAKLFLVNSGIDASRIQAVGYGESIPLNDCVDGVECTEKEHQFNRRTQVRILNSTDVDVENIKNAPEVVDEAE